MDNMEWYLLALLIGFAIAILIVVPLLKRKGMLNDISMGFAKEGIKGMEGVAHMLKTAFPDNNTILIADKILSYASIGVANAEQLYKTEIIKPEERKKEAIKFVRESLLISGVKPDEKLMMVADKCIEAAVYALGHSTSQDKEIT